MLCPSNRCSHEFLHFSQALLSHRQLTVIDSVRLAMCPAALLHFCNTQPRSLPLGAAQPPTSASCNNTSTTCNGTSVQHFIARVLLHLVASHFFHHLLTHVLPYVCVRVCVCMCPYAALMLVCSFALSHRSADICTDCSDY